MSDNMVRIRYWEDGVGYVSFACRGDESFVKAMFEKWRDQVRAASQRAMAHRRTEKRERATQEGRRG